MMRSLYRFRHLVLSIIFILGLYALLGFIVAPYVVKTYGIPAISQQLNRPVLLEDIQINPFTLSARFTDFVIEEPDQSAIMGFDELFIDFEAVSLFRQAYTFKEISVVLPFVRPRILPDKKLNLLRLLPTQAGETPSEKKDTVGIPPVRVELIQVQSGVIEYRDESKRKLVMIDVVPIEVVLKNFSTKPGSDNPYSFTAEFGEGETVSWNGSFSLEPLESDGTISLANLNLVTFWKTIQEQFNFDLRSGTMDLDLRYRLRTPADTINLHVQDGKIAFRQLQLTEKGQTEPLVSVPSIKLNEVRFDLAEHDLAIGTVASSQGRVRAWIEPDGSINYAALFPSSEPDEAEGTAAPGVETPPQEKADPWSIAVKTVQLDGYAVAVEDRSLSPPASMTIDDLRLTAKEVQFPSAKPWDLTAELLLNRTGEVAVDGSIGLNPITADLRLELAHVGLGSFQPYVDRFLLADVDGGEFHADGTLRFAAKPVDEPLLKYEGAASITDFELGDRLSQKPLLSWQTLALRDMAVEVKPTAIRVGEIEWREPSLKVTADSDGTLNVSRLVRESEGAPSAAAEGPAPVIAVEKVNLVNLGVTFVDQSTDPPVTTAIGGLSGTVEGLSSKQVARATVKLAGKVDQIAPITVRGKINPLSEQAYTDLTVTFNNFDLTTASPYAGKYVGYPISKGKLFLDLRYQVSQHQLRGENKVVIDQLNFGQDTNSPDATSLPVRLAVALLKDRRGKITVDLPVRGDLSEPDFRYGRVLLNALGNLVKKVATSPFAALGNLVGGGGEELQYLAFDPGSAELTEAARSKMQTLAKALIERPALRLEIMGRADPQIDGPVLADQKVDAAVLARYRELDRASAPSRPSSDRRNQLLNELYIQQFGRQPLKRQEISGGKAVDRVMTSEEVAAELAAKQEITDVDLRQLAQLRAGRIRAFVVGEKETDQGSHLSEDRVFLLEVQLGGAKNGQVRSQLSLDGA